MTRRAAIGTVALLATAALVGPQSPAAADSGTVSLPRGDAPATIDITRLSVVNGERRFSMRVEVRDLQTVGEFTFYYWGGVHESPPARSLLITVTSVDGVARARFHVCGREDCVRAKCRGLRVHWDAAADRLGVSAPQRCYPPRGADAGPPDMGRFSADSYVGQAVDYAQAQLLLARG